MIDAYFEVPNWTAGPVLAISSAHTNLSFGATKGGSKEPPLENLYKIESFKYVFKGYL